jgi:hypothetical protein
MGYFEAKAAQGTDQYVMEYIGPQIADMGVVINGRPTTIKPYLSRLEWLKGLPRTAKGVKETKSH